MLGVDLTPALGILGAALALSILLRVVLAIGAARAARRGAAIVASVPRAVEAREPEEGSQPAGEARKEEAVASRERPEP